jgi:hypothetical protein
MATFPTLRTNNTPDSPSQENVYLPTDGGSFFSECISEHFYRTTKTVKLASMSASMDVARSFSFVIAISVTCQATTQLSVQATLSSFRLFWWLPDEHARYRDADELRAS